MKKASFWDESHPLSELQEELSTELVPAHGNAATAHGELLRCASSLYYDVYNNGFCNADVLQPKLELVESYFDRLKPLVEDPESLKRFRSALRNAGDDDRDPDEKFGVYLEDVLTAVVKFVAKATGKTLPKETVSA